MAATRVSAKEGLAPLDVALMRYAIPALILSPLWWRTFQKLKSSPPWALLGMLGWGAPFLWLVTKSLQHSNVIYLATIVPCTMPLFAVVAERVFFAYRPSRTQLIGFMLIASATLLVVINALSGTNAIDLPSLLMMLMAAAGWASYVVSFRHTGLTAFEGATWVGFASSALILIIKLVTGEAILSMTQEQFMFNALSQGLLSGFAAVILYTLAIDRLGSARAASVSVLVPVLAALFAWVWLAETPTLSNVVALVLGATGAAVVNGIFGGQRRGASKPQ